jgi:CheY-like chemotaxis protein
MKRALIVDDSRLARHVLGKLLMTHGVEANTADSAEAALDYLKSHRPDVIFLDHQMPGMDGFEALEAIKKNPGTATIPVMMYTSKEGEVYLGQARALGALGVLPKNMKPVEVTKVLRSLHLIPGEPERAPPQPAQPLDEAQLRLLLAELFYEQNSALRDDLRRELRSAIAPPTLEPPPTMPAPAPNRGYKIASALLLAIAVVFAYLFYSTRTLLTESYQRANNLASAATQLAGVAGIVPPQTAAEPSRGVLEVLQWGFNQGGRFAFDEMPLGDARANVLTTLLAELDRVGFTGNVALDIHLGRFCMSYGADGALKLEEDARPAVMCEQIGWDEAEAAAIGQGESLTFAYALADLARRYPQMQIDKVLQGTSSPRAPYPTSYAATAGEWNAVAVYNQRVELRLVPN